MSIRACVIGTPIDHSLSPVIFNYLAQALGVNHFKYTKKNVLENELQLFVKKAKSASDFLGFNVTIPHKEKIKDYLDDFSDEVKVIGASNAVSIYQGKLHGYNTDVTGVLNTLKDQKLNLTGQSVYLFGAGGAAKAMCYALGELYCKTVWIDNRTPERALKMAKQFNEIFPQTRFEVVEDQSLKNEIFSLVVNTTSVGMGNFKKDEVLRFKKVCELRFGADAIAFDLIYNPEFTLFLRECTALGLKTLGGLDMLIYQAFETWEILFHSDVKLNLSFSKLKSYLRNVLSNKKNIYLTGFMGVGKSTVGKVLAEQLKMDFLDTDQLIEKKANQTISEIFKTKGESVFRELEIKSIIEAIGGNHNLVLSLGGGALQNKETLNRLVDSGTLIYLSADPSELFDRTLKTAHLRPILASVDPENRLTKIKELLIERQPQYQQAHLVVDTIKKSVENVVQEIVSGMNKEKCDHA